MALWPRAVADRWGRLCAAAGGALAARNGQLLGRGLWLFFDIARNLAQGRGYELVAGKLTAFRVPGYPLFLLAITGGEWHPWAIVMAQALIGALTVVATGLIGRALFGRGAGLIAAAGCAVYPYYLIHDTALQETALVTCLTAWATFLLLRLAQKGTLWLALLAGAMLAAAVLTRETILPFALCAPLWASWRVAAKNANSGRKPASDAGGRSHAVAAAYTPGVRSICTRYPIWRGALCRERSAVV